MCGYCKLLGPVNFKDIQCKLMSLQKGIHAPIETRSERNCMLTTNVHQRTFKRIKFDNQDDLTQVLLNVFQKWFYVSLSENHIVFRQNTMYFHFSCEIPTA